MGLFDADDKYQDRAWDYSKRWSQQTGPLFQSVLDRSMAFSQDPSSVLQNPVFDWVKQQTAKYGNQPIAETDTYKTMQNLFAPFMQPGSIQGSEAYKLADQLYSQQALPLYDQLLDPLKRGIEGQFGNQIDQILSSGVTGGGLASLLSQAGLSRAQALGDTEKQLRTQDILRQDAMNQNRADALAKMISQLQSQQSQQQFGAAGLMGQGALNIGQQQNQQGLMRDQMLANLLQGLYADEMTRATQLGMSGKNARLGTVTNLAQSEAGQNAGIMSGLMNMGSMLGLGLGASGALTGLGSLFGGGIGGMTAGATGPGTMAELAALGVFAL